MGPFLRGSYDTNEQTIAAKGGLSTPAKAFWSQNGPPKREIQDRFQTTRECCLRQPSRFYSENKIDIKGFLCHVTTVMESRQKAAKKEMS